MKYKILILFFIIHTQAGLTGLFAQSGLCDSITPFFQVNLAGNPNGTWLSNPPIIREGLCCGSLAPDKCIEFEITLDSSAVAINFNIATGAIPSGAMFYQIGCNPPTPVGQPICLDGPGPYTLTFCKPGNNLNTYEITAYSTPNIGPDVLYTTDNCQVQLNAYGVDSAATFWNDITGGGIYNDFLSCTTCASPILTPHSPYPSYIDYTVCTIPYTAICNGGSNWCDTIRVYLAPPLTVSISPGSPSFCVNQSGIMLSANNSGGAPPFTYIWTNGTGTVVGNSNTYFASTPGLYYVEVSDTLSYRCGSQSASINVAMNPLPTVSVTPQSSTICIGSNVTISASGGSSYQWTNGSTSSSITVNPSITTSYYVTVTNIYGCSATGNTVITVNPLPIPNAGTDQTICQGQSSILTASGGSTFQWSNGLTSPSINVAPSITSTYTVTVTNNGCTASDEVIVNINTLPVANAGPDIGICYGAFTTLIASASSGVQPYSFIWSNGVNTLAQLVLPGSTTTYAVNVTDANGCTSQDNVTVTVFPQPTVSIAASTPENCNSSNGGITVTVSGGTLPYQYRWNTTPIQYTQNINGIPQGVYIVTVTDNNQCSAIVSGVITEIPPPIISSVVQSESCSGTNDGFAAATVIGPTLPFTYLWSTGSTSQIISNLPGGVYYLTVTDAAGCTDTASFNVGSHPIINLTTSSTDSHCNHSDGTAFVSASGGSGNFSYLWSNFQTTQNLTNIQAGTYTVTVTDGFCTSTASVSLGTLSGPNVSIINTVNETCTAGNGSALAIATGGTSGYTYHWNSFPSQTTQALQNVHAGTYIVTISDVNGCTATNTVALSNSPPPAPSVVSTISASCGIADGSADITVTGGVAPYIYYWNTSPPMATQDLINVFNGTYTVTVTDANGCTAVTTVLINENPGPVATIISQNEICDRSNGSATVSASGGTGIYTYLWNNGQTSATISGLPYGNYTVTVSDGGCSATALAFVQNTPGPNASFNAHPNLLTILEGPVIFNDYSTGNIIDWQWNFGDGSPFGNGTYNVHPYTNIGEYIVTLIVTDNNGCMDTIADTINVKDIFALYIPDAFTPNGDGLNDFFSPSGINVDPDHFDMYIFDRWGKILYHTNIWHESENKCEEWNGTVDNKYGLDKTVVGVYVYKIFAKEISGLSHLYYGKVAIVK